MAAQRRQFSTQAQQIVGAVNIASGLLDGADITADARYLYVADPALYGNQGLFHRVDLNSHGIANFSFPRTANENGTWDVALSANGKGLFDTTYTSMNMLPLRQINLNTMAITTRTDDPGAGGGGKIPVNTMIQRSADRSLFLFAQANLSNGPIFTYNANTDTFRSGPSIGTNLTNAPSAVNRNGTLMAFEIPGGLLVMDQNFNVRNFIQGGLNGGVIFDPNLDVMYAVNSATSQVIAYDTNTWQVKYQMAIGEQTTPARLLEWRHGSQQRRQMALPDNPHGCSRIRPARSEPGHPFHHHGQFQRHHHRRRVVRSDGRRPGQSKPNRQRLPGHSQLWQFRLPGGTAR